MDVREFEYFVTIAELGSVTKAAARLYVTQSALSKFIQRKETELGTPLFDRIGKRFVPTRAGEICLAASYEVLRINRQMELDVAQESLENGLCIRFAFPSGCSDLFFKTIYPDFIRKFGNVNLQVHEITTKQAMEFMEQRLLDLSICSFDKLPPPAYEYVPLSPIYLALAVNPDSPLLEKAVLNPETGMLHIDLTELNDSPLILRSPGSHTREFTDQLLASHHIKPHVILETTSRENAARAVEYGVGAAFLPNDPAIFISHKKIRFLSFDGGKPILHVAAVYRKEKKLTKPEQFLLEMFQERYAELRDVQMNLDR